MTPFQTRVLETLFESGLSDLGYFFTGGTALAEFYLQHRFSDDLDIFIREHQSIKGDFTSVKRLLEEKSFEVFSEVAGDEFVRFFVRDSEETGPGLKVELARQAGVQLSPSMAVGKIVVDSFEDIAVNKICAIYGRIEVKDFVDLFFILRQSNFSLDYLVARAKEKDADFEREDTVLEFATRLLAVGELQLHQIRMIKSLSLDDLRSYLRPKAEELIRLFRPARVP